MKKNRLLIFNIIIFSSVIGLIVFRPEDPNVYTRRDGMAAMFEKYSETMLGYIIMFAVFLIAFFILKNLFNYIKNKNKTNPDIKYHTSDEFLKKETEWERKLNSEEFEYTTLDDSKQELLKQVVLHLKEEQKKGILSEKEVNEKIKEVTKNFSK